MGISSTDGPHTFVHFYDADDFKACWTSQVQSSVVSVVGFRNMPVEKIFDTLKDENCIAAAHPMGYFGNNKGMEDYIRKCYLSEDTAKRLDAYEMMLGHEPCL